MGFLTNAVFGVILLTLVAYVVQTMIHIQEDLQAVIIHIKNKKT